jgi:single-stranded DNA-binding protein
MEGCWRLRQVVTMVTCINKAILLGAISKAGVTIRYNANGTPCASFVLLLTEQTADGKYFSHLIPCEVWGKRAEEVRALAPGALVVVEGKVSRRRKGERSERSEWETVISSFDAQPVLAPAGPTPPLGWPSS